MGSLVLKRKVGENLIINDDIRIKICAIENAFSVKLLIQAPDSVSIWREEVFLKRKDNQQNNE